MFRELVAALVPCKHMPLGGIKHPARSMHGAGLARSQHSYRSILLLPSRPSLQAVQHCLAHQVQGRWLPSEQLKLLRCLTNEHLHPTDCDAALCLSILHRTEGTMRRRTRKCWTWTGTGEYPLQMLHVSQSQARITAVCGAEDTSRQLLVCKQHPAFNPGEHSACIAPSVEHMYAICQNINAVMPDQSKRE